MKVVMQPIEVIAWFDLKGGLTPIKFRIETSEHELKIVRVNKILFSKKEKIAGNSIVHYSCVVIINKQERACELKYEVLTCKWTLFKI